MPIGARSTRCRRESNEIPCVRALLTLLPITCGGWSPWMRCIPRSSREVDLRHLEVALPDDRQVNQAKILARITALPWAECPQPLPTTPRPRPCQDPHPANHHRCTRIGFPYAKQIIRITRERLITAPTSAAWRWSMPSAACRSSTPPYRDHDLDASTLRNRDSLHWIRDVTFDEDRHRPHTGHGAQVLATLRNTAINLHRLNGATTSPKPAGSPL
ncbi:putative transposase for IS2404 [Mycobacterium ulcerans str. Harvey]|uniref:Transposase for IS2404 n=1 Tax=Mycobacterium ulcerans str. Harvey TaxID=1299332 RepID=A0ABN0R984_MYCUL|nr:putative transposase for IS2404 [Mycobacterium ulcerans str. Harvey]